MSNFGLTDKEEFLNALKYPECSHCTGTMFCKFGCGKPNYPQGLRDIGHPRWEEVIRDYIAYYDGSDIKSDSLAEHIRKAKQELKRREENG